MNMHRAQLGAMVLVAAVSVLLWHLHSLSAADSALPPRDPLTGAPVAAQWEIGDSWTVAVEDMVFGDEGTLEVKVTGSELVDREDCWRLDFQSGAQGPREWRGYHHTVFVSKRDGQPRRVLEVPEHKAPPSLMRWGGVWLNEVPFVILPVSSGYFQAYDQQASIAVRLARDQVLDLKVTTTQGQEELHVRQVWPAGAKWWTEYEEFSRDGAMVVRARRIEPAPEPLLLTPPPSKEEQEARERKRRATEASMAPIRKAMDDARRRAQAGQPPATVPPAPEPPPPPAPPKQ